MQRVALWCLQVIVTVCGHTKCTGIVRLGLKHRNDVIVINQELDFVLTGEQVKLLLQRSTTDALPHCGDFLCDLTQ